LTAWAVALKLQGFLYFRLTSLYAILQEMPHDYAEVHRQLEEAVARLKRATDPDLRRKLLTEIRRLLKEADRLNNVAPK